MYPIRCPFYIEGHADGMEQRVARSKREDETEEQYYSYLKAYCTSRAEYDRSIGVTTILTHLPSEFQDKYHQMRNCKGLY
jgi:hypothetical protein